MNIGLVVALISLTSLALAALLVPLLLRRHSAAARDAYNLAVYRDQLAEIERDLGRSLVSTDQAEAARAEIGRRILALRPAETAAGSSAGALAATAAAIFLLPIAAWLLYWQLGSPALPDQPFAARHAAANGAVATKAPHIDVNDAVARLGGHLKDHPDDLTGWLLLARSEMSLSHYAAASEAYRHAAGLTGQRPDIVGDWGEAQVMAAGGVVTPAAREAFMAALKDPETAPRSRYYLALAQLQNGDAKGALKAWTDLAAEAPADAEWLPVVRRQIAEAAAKLGIDPATLQAAGSSGPSSAAVTAAAKATADASPEERQAMINAMVARLAARLEQQPDDVEGWARLGRSYMVLGRPEKARDAFTHAIRLKPEDAALKAALDEATAATAGGAAAK